MGDGLDLNLPFTLGCLWAIFCADLVQDLEYQMRPVRGRGRARPTRVVAESVELPLRGLPQAAAPRAVARRRPGT